jgi:hypothetical protein
MPKRHNLDRSTMFSVLLGLSPNYGRLESRQGEHITTLALKAWYEDPEATDMFAFTKKWIQTERRDLLPPRAHA